MTPSPITPGDSLAAVVAELRKIPASWDVILHLSNRIEYLDAKIRKQQERLRDALLDPNQVHVFMLRGVIAKPTWRALAHMIGDHPTPEESQTIEIAELRAKLAACGWQPIEQSQPKRDSWAIYWHVSEDGGFPDIAHEWRDEDHRRYASHWLPYESPTLASRAAAEGKVGS